MRGKHNFLHVQQLPVDCDREKCQIVRSGLAPRIALNQAAVTQSSSAECKHQSGTAGTQCSSNGVAARRTWDEKPVAHIVRYHPYRRQVVPPR